MILKFWQSDLLSFSGRASRRDWWLLVFVPPWLLGAAMMGSLWLLTFNIFLGLAFILFLGIISTFLSWLSLSVGVKRLHDQDRSGFWLIAFIIPPTGAFWLVDEFEKKSPLLAIIAFGILVLFGLWTLFELGVRRGTAGTNRYGPPRTTSPS